MATSRLSAPIAHTCLRQNTRKPTTSVFRQQQVKQLQCGDLRPRRRHCHYSLLTFLCKGRQKPKNVDFSTYSGFAMTMAAAIENRTAEAQAWCKTSRVGGLDILHDLSQAETIWRSLESPRQFSTPYQRFAFLSPWPRQGGARDDRLRLI